MRLAGIQKLTHARRQQVSLSFDKAERHFRTFAYDVILKTVRVARSQFSLVKKKKNLQQKSI